MHITEYVTYDAEEMLRLYASVGWTAYTDQPDLLREGFRHSLLTLVVREGTELLGLIRCVGDGNTIVFVQDLLVSPEYQRKGIGSALLRAVLERYSHVRQIELVTDEHPETLAFYEAMGFQKMAELGCCGMMRLGS